MKQNCHEIKPFPDLQKFTEFLIGKKMRFYLNCFFVAFVPKTNISRWIFYTLSKMKRKIFIFTKRNEMNIQNFYNQVRLFVP